MREKEKLLTEILTGEELSALREQSLSRGLKAMRRQRRSRSAVRAAAVLIATGLLGLGIWRSQRPTGMEPRAVVTATDHMQHPAETAGPVEFIGDDELLALFPHRAVALIGKPGEQQLVFLDPTQDQTTGE